MKKFSPNSLAIALNIQTGEYQPSMFLIIYSFFLGCGVFIFDTVSYAMFLYKYDASSLPYAYIIIAAVIICLGSVYSRLGEYLSTSKLMKGTLVMLFISVFLFRIAFNFSDAKWLAFGLLLWNEVLTILTGLIFWNLANRIFDTQQGKRLFGLIGCGEIVAGMICGFLTPGLVNFMGTLNLLWISAVSLTFALVVLIGILKVFRDSIEIPESEGERHYSDPLSEVLGDNYLQLILFVTILSITVYYFVDFAFYNRAEILFTNEDQLARFLGIFFGVIQGINLFIRIFFSGWLLNKYGLKLGLSLLPILLLCGIFTSAIYGSILGIGAIFFWMILGTKLIDEVVRNTIDSPSMVLLFQPLPVQYQLSAQTIIEVIVSPFATGLSGILLVIFFSADYFSVLHLSFITLAILLDWLVISILMHREYSAALMKAVNNRILQGLSPSFIDASSTEVLKSKLKSPYPDEVIYSLNILENVQPELQVSFLFEILDHPLPVIRQEVLNRFARLKLSSLIPVIQKRIEMEESPIVKSTAIHALCMVGESEVVEQVAPYIDDPNPQVRLGAMVGLLSRGGIEGVLLAGEKLLGMEKSQNPEDREFTARVLGDVGMRSFYKPLLFLLKDKDQNVRMAALEAAGKIKNPRLWPLVIDNLPLPTFCRGATSALVAAGTEIIPSLESILNNKDQPKNVLIRVARVLGQIGDVHAIEILRQHINHPEKDVQYQILASLTKCKFSIKDTNITFIVQLIKQEITESVWKLSVINDLADESFSIIKQALQQDINKVCNRIFFLLSFIYNASNIMSVRDKWAFDLQEKTVVSIERIKDIIDPGLSEILLPILQNNPPGETLHILHDYFPQTPLNHVQRIQEIISRTDIWIDSWTRACGIYLTGKLSIHELKENVVESISDTDILIRETSIYTLARLEKVKYKDYVYSVYPDSNNEINQLISRIERIQKGEKGMLMLLEKVLLLKSLNIFSEIPENILMKIAAALVEEEYKANATIFKEGDLGRCMYIIIEGKVLIHLGNNNIARLGARNVFGEMAILDRQPRSASATTLEDTKLLRLDQDVFSELLLDHPGIAKGIIQVLIQRLRQLLHERGTFKKQVKDAIDNVLTEVG